MNPKIQKRLLRVASELNRLDPSAGKTAKSLPPDLEKAFDMLESAAQHDDIRKMIDDLYIKMTGRS